MKFLGNFKLIAVIVSIVLFMAIMYGYNRVEKRKLKVVDQGGAHYIEGQMPQHLQRQQQAMNAYKRPNLGQQAKKGCGVCGNK